jgi:hypothetical protein
VHDIQECAHFVILLHSTSTHYAMWCRPPIPPKVCVTSRSRSFDSGAEMALLVSNWNPSDNYTGPLRMLSWIFQAPSVCSHSARPRAMTKCQDEKTLIRDRDFLSQVSFLLVSRTSSSQNAEMVHCSLLRDFSFCEIWKQGISLLLRTSGRQKVEMLGTSRFQDFAFRKIRIQRVSLLLGVSSCQKDEMTQHLFLFGILPFTKSRCKKCPCSLEFPVTEKSK